MEKKKKATKKKEDIEKESINKSTKKEKKKKKHPKLRLLIKILLIMFLICFIIGGGILGAILYRCIWGDWALQEGVLKIDYLNSTIYDKNGDIIGTISGNENRQIISKEEMSPYLFDAFIAIEDERFETHSGVDWKRTLGAIFTFATNKGESSYGGSTITQQVIKNLTDERDDSGIDGALRKIKEIVRAYQAENYLSKDQILELYLNLIPLGGQMYGVQTASIHYFNKPAKDLSLVESAYLAGITHAPSMYNPFSEKDRSENIKKRVTNVLWKMRQLGKINEEEYNSALEEIENGIKFEKGSVSQNNLLPYLTELAIKEIENDMMEKNNLTKKEAELQLYGGGYKIYTTYDPDIQSAIEEEYIDNASKWTNKYKTVKREKADGEIVEEQVRAESAIAIIDFKTGQVVGGTDGFGEKTAEKSWGKSRITEHIHSPGSSIKPIAVIGPSLEEGLITAGTVVDDTPFKQGSYSPKNDTGNFYGLMNIRWIIRVSRNIPEVKMMKNLTVAKSLKYLDAFGLDTSTEQEDGLSLALGGMTHGPTVLQMSAAYAAIANDGVYIEPTFYTKVEDANGNVVVESEQDTRRVLSVQNAWILKTILKESTGTGFTGSSGATSTRAKVKNQDTAGKTGTTNESKALWFCGFTPYYAAAVWRGYDIETDGKVPGNSGTSAALWGTIMTKIHEDLPAAKFEQPEGIVTAKICSKSGLLATEKCNCGSQEHGLVYTEYFVKGTVPTEHCDVHVTARVCEESGKLVGENCKNGIERVFITRENSDSDDGWQKASDAIYMLPTETCEDCKPEVKPVENQTTEVNTTTGVNTTDGNTSTNTNSTPTDKNTTNGNSTATDKPTNGNEIINGNTSTGGNSTTNVSTQTGSNTTTSTTPINNENTAQNSNESVNKPENIIQ